MDEASACAGSGAIPFSSGTPAVLKVVSSQELHFTGFLWGPWLTDIYYPQFKLRDSSPRPEVTEHGHRVMGVAVFSATRWILSEHLLCDKWSMVMLSTYFEDAHSLGSHKESTA